MCIYSDTRWCDATCASYPLAMRLTRWSRHDGRERMSAVRALFVCVVLNYSYASHRHCVCVVINYSYSLCGPVVCARTCVTTD